MRYYILPTTQFAEQCIGNGIYGATSSNWLANIDSNDRVFISQFNYKAQNIYGPCKVEETLFYDKSIIYPNQKYYYRIKITQNKLKFVEETDLYINGIEKKCQTLALYLISLIQQNKHLHSLSLTDKEGEFLFETLARFGIKVAAHEESTKSYPNALKVDKDFLINKNRLLKNPSFSSESDLETFILFNLKDKDSDVYDQIRKLLSNYPKNSLDDSEIYNQFIFGNAYPVDMVIFNRTNINVFELKKDALSATSVVQIQKEMQKHLYYSLFSNRLQSKNIESFNFYLVYSKHKSNERLRRLLSEYYNNLLKKISAKRKNTLTCVEYSFQNDALLLEKV